MPWLFLNFCKQSAKYLVTFNFQFVMINLCLFHDNHTIKQHMITPMLTNPLLSIHNQDLHIVFFNFSLASAHHFQLRTLTIFSLSSDNRYVVIPIPYSFVRCLTLKPQSSFYNHLTFCAIDKHKCYLFLFTFNHNDICKLFRHFKIHICTTKHRKNKKYTIIIVLCLAMMTA